MNPTTIHIIAGDQGSGKSTLMVQLLQEARLQQLRCGGFLAKGYWHCNKRSGFDLQLIDSGRVFPFCRDKQLPGWQPLRRFFFSQDALQAGIIEMTSIREHKIDLWLIDEIGPIELKGGLWHDLFADLVKNHEAPMVVSMRPDLAEEICRYFEIKDYLIHPVGETSASKLLADITYRVDD